MDAETLSESLDQPLSPPPPGVTPNFGDADSIDYQLYVTAGVCIPLMLAFSFMRFWATACLDRKKINTIDESEVFILKRVLCSAADIVIA